MINPIVPGSVELTDKTSPAGPTYVWNDVELSGRWVINDYSGQEGDTFTIGLPAAFEGTSGTCELVGSAQAPVGYGTCTVSRVEVSCVLNGNVVGKTGVGGEFFINTRVGHLTREIPPHCSSTEEPRLRFRSRTGRRTSAIPRMFLTTFQKLATALGDPYDSLAWKIRIPGQELSGKTLTIDDTFKVPGSTLTAKLGEVILYRIPNHNPLCWNENWRADCCTVVYKNDGANYPGVTANIDDTTQIQLTYNKSEEFFGDDMYLFEYILSVAERFSSVGSTRTPSRSTMNPTKQRLSGKQPAVEPVQGVTTPLGV